MQDNAYRYSKTLAEQAAWVWMASAHNSHNYGIGGKFTNPQQIKEALDQGGQVSALIPLDSFVLLACIARYRCASCH